MPDGLDMGWTRYDTMMEEQAIRACWTTAQRNGHTAEEAENCDDGAVGCPDCPFKKSEIKEGGK